MSAPISDLFADALSEADAGAAIGRGIRFMQKARAMGSGSGLSRKSARSMKRSPPLVAPQHRKLIP